MKKMKYIQPQASIVLLASRSNMLEASNTFNGNSATVNPETMEEGDGSNAASRRRRHRSAWEEEEDEEAW